MTRNEAIDLLDNLIGMIEDNHESDYDTALRMGIKALEYDDAKYHEEHGEVIVDKAVWEDAKRALEQEPKTGHWIDGGEYICFGGRQKAPCICSVCRKSALNEPWYYCHNCGARMFEPQEEGEI